MTGAPGRELAFEFECVTLGPAIRRQGRDFGLRTRGTRLTDSGEVLLEDFALSLSEWAKQGTAPFEILFWLGDRDRHYVLLKAAFLGPGGMGPIAVAQGLLIPEAALDAIGGNAHRLLPLIPEPSMTPWDARSMEVHWDVQAGVPLAGASDDGLPPTDVAALGLMLADRRPPWPSVDIRAAEGADRSRRLILDAIPWLRVAARPSWTSNADLRSMGRFSPSEIALTLTTGRAGADIAVSGDAVTPKPPPAPAGLRLLTTLFRVPADDEELRLSPAAQRELNQSLKWKVENAKLRPRDIIVNAIQDLVRRGLSSGDFWDVLVMVARNVNSLTCAADRDEAESAITTLFATTASRKPDRFARLLSQYVSRIAPHLPGQEDKPFLWVLERDALGWLEPGDVRKLAGGLAERYPGRLADALEAQQNLAATDRGRMPLEAAVALIEELNGQYARSEPTPAALAISSAAIGLAAALLRDAGEGEARARLAMVASARGELLMTDAACGVAGWAKKAFAFVPRLVAVMRHPPLRPSLLTWAKDARVELASAWRDAGKGAAEIARTKALIRLLVIQGLVAGRPAGQPE